MSDFSSFALFTAGLAVFAPLVAAVDKVQLNVPGGSDPTAGAIFTPGLNDVVPAGAAYTITWDPAEDTCGDKVDLVLLNGKTAVQMAPYWYVARNVDNSGEYDWIVSTEFAPSASDYGLQLVCLETQAYQYSTRFGLSNEDYVEDHATSNHTTTNSTTTASGTAGTATTASASRTITPIATGSGYHNGTDPTPTGAVTVPSTLRETVTSTAATRTGSAAASTTAPAPTGAAAAMQAGASGLFVAAALAAFVL